MKKDLLVGPLKILCPGILLKSFTLSLTKNYKKTKQIVFLLITAAFYESILQTLSKKYPTYGHKTHNTMNIRNFI